MHSQNIMELMLKLMIWTHGFENGELSSFVTYRKCLMQDLDVCGLEWLLKMMEILSNS